MEPGAPSSFKDILKSSSYLPLDVVTESTSSSSFLLDYTASVDIDSDVASFDKRVGTIVNQLKAAASECIFETKQRAVCERDEYIQRERELRNATVSEMQLRIEALSSRVHELEDASRKREIRHESLVGGMLRFIEGSRSRNCKESVFKIWKVSSTASAQRRRLSADLCDSMYNRRLKFRAFASILNSSKANKMNDMILTINKLNSEKMQEIQSENATKLESLQMKIEELTLELTTETSRRIMVEEKQAKIISTLNFLNVEATSISAAYPPSHPRSKIVSGMDALNTTIGSDEGPRDHQALPRPLPVPITPSKATAAGSAKRAVTPRSTPAKAAAKASPLSTAIFHSPMAGISRAHGKRNATLGRLNVIVTKSQ